MTGSGNRPNRVTFQTQHSLPLETVAGQNQEASLLPRIANMPQTDLPNLIRMIRLLDGELSADEAAPLRRLIANDLRPTEQYQQLTRVLQQPMSSDDLLRHAGKVTPLSVAKFIEGRMTESEQARFERKCRTSNSLLREVVSTWRAEQEATATGWETVADERVRSVVSSLLKLPDVEPPPVMAESETRQKAVQENCPELKAASILPPVSTDLPQIVVAVAPEPVRPGPRRPKGKIFAAAAIMLALVLLVVQYIGRPDVNQQARPGDPEREVSPENSDPPTMIVREEPEQKDALPDKRPVIPKSPDPKDGTEQNPIVRKEPSSTPMPDKPVPDPGVTLPPPVELVEWSDIRGIVGVRDVAASEWSGMLNAKAADLWKSNARTQLLTFANSAAAGKAVNGAWLMAAADSLVEISAERKQESRNAVTDEELIPICEVQFGRLALVGLNEGQRVIVRVGGESFEVRATRDETTIAIERDGQETVLAAYRGEAAVDGHELTRRKFGLVDSVGSMSVFRPLQVYEWTRSQPGPTSLPADLCAEFNESEDLVQTAASVRQSTDPVTGYVATQVALQCSASGSQPLPLSLARQIAGSGNEIHRQTLVQWLVARVQRNPSTGDADLTLLFRLEQVDRQTETMMTGWFQAAAEGRRPTAMQLTELTTGLRDPAPLFTKQCAKFFLQKILGDPLTEYDPQTPASRTALSSVTRKVRAWQQANLQ
jgi:hypothetical protein